MPIIPQPVEFSRTVQLQSGGEITMTLRIDGDLLALDDGAWTLLKDMAARFRNYTLSEGKLEAHHADPS